MAGIKDYSTTAANNTTIGSINTAEGMLPSNINNAFRGLAAEIREWYNDSQWVIYGDGDGSFTITYASATSFTVSSVDVTSFYHVGRRVKAIATTPGTIYGTISATTFSTNTTVTVTWDSGSLANEAVSIYVAALSKTNDSIPELVITNSKVATAAAINATKIHDGSVSNTEFGYLDGVTSAIQTQLNAKQATITGAATTVVTSDLTASRAAISNSSGKIAVSTVTDTELGYVSGVTSAIQTQIGTKLTASNNLSDVSSTSTARTNLGLAIGTNVQAYDAELQAIAGLTSAADKGIQFTGSGTAAVFDLTTAGKALLDDADASTQRTTLGLGTISTQNANNVAVTGGTITGLTSPSSGSDAATKTYVDNLITGIKTRIICRAASTANVVIASALENGDTLDGVTLVTGDRVLLKNQSTGSQNGIYTVVASGSASRDTEFDVITELAGQLVIIQEGTVNADTIFLCTTDTSATLGSSTITFTKVEPTNSGTVTSVVAGTGLTGGTITSSGTIAIDTSVVTTLTGSQTLTNKTLTTPVISSISNTGTLTLPTSTDTLVGRATTDTLTNKTLTLPTIDNIKIGYTTTATAAGTTTLTVSSNYKQYFTGSTTQTIVLPVVTTLTLGHTFEIHNNSTSSLTVNSSGSNLVGTIQGNTTAVCTCILVTGTTAASWDFDVTGFTSALATTRGGTGLTSIGTSLQVLRTNTGATALEFATLSTGTSWQSVKTSGFTAVAGEGYPCNTTSSAFTVTLPASPSAGDEVIILDYAGTFDTNALTINPNGNKIEGGTSNVQLTGEREGARLVYIDSTQGWLAYSGINEGSDALSPAPYSIDFLVIAGGGSGGQEDGGGGGAGGYRTSTQTANIGTVITVTVGDGGASIGSGVDSQGNDGSNSSISGSGLTTITSTGGGGGGAYTLNARNGGSGGGAGGSASVVSGGSGNTPSTSPSQGNNGGASFARVSFPSNPGTGGGGGGAGAVGSTGISLQAGNGGAGTASSITGSSVTRAGGGGGGAESAPALAGSGGTGGGGAGTNAFPSNATAGTANTGSGGGGTGGNNSAGSSSGAGGKGVVILSVPDGNYSGTTTGSPTVTPNANSTGKTVIQFNGSGSYTT